MLREGKNNLLLLGALIEYGLMIRSFDVHITKGGGGDNFKV
jgi:hypothetical protein